MKSLVKWNHKESKVFHATSGSGHPITMGLSPDHGGHNEGARPMELLLIGAAGCMSVDIVSILEKARQVLTDCEVDIQAGRAPTPPQVFTKIHLIITVTGENLSEQRVTRAIELSLSKYCSAMAMLSKTATVSYEYQIKG
ncbi:peroxiredoxin [Basilea psittacipulmonis DSM 24701]|uniref:Peroxiredoxin n=2 Tax=Basilea TaxID=1472344 RepID=A0A077DE81_9BURK|nr:peroxiredoxin [Basilea psittacipulmonis DSM 24701]